MIGGNWKHVEERLERIADQDYSTLRKAITGLAKRVKAKRVPIGPWYRTVLNNGRAVCHICGQGAYISTILGADMYPRGRRI